MGVSSSEAPPYFLLWHFIERKKKTKTKHYFRAFYKLNLNLCWKQIIHVMELLMTMQGWKRYKIWQSLGLLISHLRLPYSIWYFSKKICHNYLILYYTLTWYWSLDIFKYSFNIRVPCCPCCHFPLYSTRVFFIDTWKGKLQLSETVSNNALWGKEKWKYIK